jgi:hypothetical protein
MGVFLAVDEFSHHGPKGTLWSWPEQNPIRHRDPEGRGPFGPYDPWDPFAPYPDPKCFAAPLSCLPSVPPGPNDPEFCEEFRKLAFAACNELFRKVPPNIRVPACITISYILKGQCEDRNPQPNGGPCSAPPPPTFPF